MRRKVIQIAGSTQLVSLPREWCIANNVKKGEDLEIIQKGDKIIVTTDTTPGKKTINIDVSDLTPRLADRFIARAYQQGYDELVIVYNSLEVGIALQTKVRELLGFDVLEQGDTKIVVRSITSKLDIDFSTSLRKSFLILLEMSRSCLAAFKKGDKYSLKNLHYRDLDLNKYCYFCLRSINKGHYDEYDKYILYYIIETLEDTGDAYKELMTQLARISPKAKFITLLDKIQEVMQLSYEYFYKPNSNLAKLTHEKLSEVKKTVGHALKNSTHDEIKTLMLYDAILRLIYHFTTMRLDKLKEAKE